MKILHLTNGISEGGVESYLLQLLPSFGENVSCDLFVVDNKKIEMLEKFSEKGVNVLINERESIYNPLVVFDIISIAKNYDVIHSHLFPTQYYVAMAKFLLSFTSPNIKFVTTEHCTTNKRRRSKFWLLEKIIYSAYDKIVCVSQASADSLSKWIGNKDKKIITIHNGIEIGTVDNIRPIERTMFGIPDNSILLCMTARFFDQKDQPTLIKAMQYLPSHVYLCLIGSGEAQDNCQILSKELGVDARVIFLGRRSDVPAIIQSADICVLSTHYEGLPVSILEYFAAGKPVVATDVDGVRELIGDISLLSYPENAEDLSRKILNLINDPDKANIISQNNKNKMKYFSLENMTRKYLDIYKIITE